MKSNHFNDIVLYNKHLSELYQKKGDSSILEKLVVTELIPPICDYYNAINLIRRNYSKCITFNLLVIGAQIVSEWTNEENDFLNVLNSMREKLGKKEQSLIWWLNAKHLQFRQNDYMLSDEYKNCLRNSVLCEKKGVFNMLAYAELSPLECDYSKQEILNNVEKVFEHEEIMSMPLEELSDAKFYISEHILGIQVSYTVFENIRERLEKIFGK